MDTNRQQDLDSSNANDRYPYRRLPNDDPRRRPAYRRSVDPAGTDPSSDIRRGLEEDSARRRRDAMVVAAATVTG